MSTEQSTESFETAAPAANAEGATAPGRGFRRRRRRNKNRPQAGSQQGGAQPQQGGEDISGAAEGGGDDAASQAAQAQPQQRQAGQQNSQNGQQNGQGFGGRRKRRKKFFQDRQGGGSAQPPVGNRADRPAAQHQFNGNGGNGGGRRKQKQRGPRSFVGPMDHMYRENNGNYADAPPSTIAVNGNHGGQRRQNNAHLHDTGHQSQFLGRVYEPPAPVIAEDAPTRVYCFIDDLFFTAKINEAARKLGVKVAFVKGDKKEDIARITDAPEDARAALVIVDLNSASGKPLAVIPKIRTKLKRTVSIIGFLSHLQGDLKAKATEAGCDTVMPRSAFSQNLPNLLRRYGLEEEESAATDAQHAYF